MRAKAAPCQEGSIGTAGGDLLPGFGQPTSRASGRSGTLSPLPHVLAMRWSESSGKSAPAQSLTEPKGNG